MRDDTKPGTGIKTLIPRSFQQWTIGPDQDALVIGSQHVAAGTRTGQFHYRGGRNVILRGFDTGNQRIITGDAAQHCFLEGIRADFTTFELPEDVVFLVGSGQTITIQNWHFRGIHGTDRDYFFGGVQNSAAITSITKAGGVITVEIAAPFPEGSPIVNRSVIIGLSAFEGTDTAPLKNYNYTWRIASVVNSTTFTIAKSEDNVLPADGTSATGGTAWMMQTTLGSHADAIQLFNQAFPVAVRIDKGTAIANSRGLIMQSNGPAYQFSRCNTRLDLTLNPQDFNTFNFWGGAGYSMDFQDFWLETRDLPDGSGKRNLESNVNPQTGVGTIVGDERRISFPTEEDFTGYMNQGAAPPTGDFANYDELGVSYVSPGYVDFPTPTAGDLTDIVIDNLAATTALAENGHIAWVDAVHTLTGQIVDIHISAGDTTRIKLNGRELVRAGVALEVGSLPFELTATVRGTGIVFGPKAFAVEVT